MEDDADMNDVLAWFSKIRFESRVEDRLLWRSGMVYSWDCFKLASDSNPERTIECVPRQRNAYEDLVQLARSMPQQPSLLDGADASERWRGRVIHRWSGRVIDDWRFLYETGHATSEGIVDHNEFVPDDTACSLEEWNAKIDALLEDIAAHDAQKG